MEEQIAKVFNDNIGNRLTMELANGMFAHIKMILDNDKEQPLIGEGLGKEDGNAQ